MKKLNKCFKNNDQLLNLNWNKHFYSFEDNIKIIIVLTSLYENNIITINKLKGQLKALKAGTLTKTKNTFHCNINNEWYDHESFSVIYKDLFNFCNISFIKLIEILQLYSGKNYNYCINIIRESIFKPLLNTFSNSDYDYFNHFINTTLIDFPEIKQKGYKYECYECGNYRFEKDHRQTNEKGIEKLNDYFHQYKKGNLSKIPKL
jgi:hypothetical protein